MYKNNSCPKKFKFKKKKIMVKKYIYIKIKDLLLIKYLKIY